MAAQPRQEDLGEALVGWAETHDAGEIRKVFDQGLDPNAEIRGRTPIEWMIEMYNRSPRFPDCVNAVLEAGAELDDEGLRAVLLDDGDGVTRVVEADRNQLRRKLSLVTTYVLLADASLLHVAAEFGNAQAARSLIEAGANVEARAAIDENGVGGQTPLFHTIASNLDHCAPVTEILLEAGARVDVRLDGLAWGKGFPWETTFYDVTPISYAQLGLLPQCHRRPEDTYDAIERLLRAAGRPVPPRVNVPNAYVLGKTT